MWREGKSMCIKKQMAKPPQRAEPISSTTPSVLNTTDSSPFIWEWSKKDIKSAPPQKKEMIKKDIKQAPEQKRNDRHQLRKVKIGLPFSVFLGWTMSSQYFCLSVRKIGIWQFFQLVIYCFNNQNRRVAFLEQETAEHFENVFWRVFGDFEYWELNNFKINLEYLDILE